jgi:putative lipoic acid-binding regulatory protein
MSEESIIKFPTPFPIKMMGRDTPEFRETVRTLVEKHTGPIDDSAVSDAVSRKGNFVSITITVIATSQEQLDNIYRDVSSHEDVLMAL